MRQKFAVSLAPTAATAILVVVVVHLFVAAVVQCEEIEICFAIEPEYTPSVLSRTDPQDEAFLRCFEEAYNQAMFLVGYEITETQFLTNEQVERFISSRTQTTTFGGGTATTESTTNYDNGESESTTTTTTTTTTTRTTNTDNKTPNSVSSSVDLSDQNLGSGSTQVTGLSPSAFGTVSSHVDENGVATSGSASTGVVSGVASVGSSSKAAGPTPSGTPTSHGSSRGSASAGGSSSTPSSGSKVTASTSGRSSSTRSSFSSFFSRFRKQGSRNLSKKRKKKNKTNVGSKGTCRGTPCMTEQLFGSCFGCRRKGRQLLRSQAETRRRLFLQQQIAAFFRDCLDNEGGLFLPFLSQSTPISVVDCITEYT